MYCSTCGARIPGGRRVCTECGTTMPAIPAEGSGSRYGVVGAEERSPTDRGVASCPRCGYTGIGIPYFSRGSHLALLIGLTVLTMGIMGAGGLIYYLLRHEHRLCPRCGLKWGKEGEVRRSNTGPASRRSAEPADAIPGHRGSGARIFSFLLLALGAVLMMIGFAEGELVPALLGMGAGGGAWLLHRTARTEREARRAALLSSLQLPVLRLARERGGRLTVTEVAAELGWTLPRAEKVLESLNDGYRVSSDVTRDGVIQYDFLELKPPRESLPGTGG